MSTPRTSAPSRANGSAVVPSPHPRSNTCRPVRTPRLWTSASPLSRIVAAIRVKFPFSHNAWFGLAVVPAIVIESPSSHEYREWVQKGDTPQIWSTVMHYATSTYHGDRPEVAVAKKFLPGVR